MALAPKRVMHRKVQRGRQHGFATRDNYIDFGDIALVAMEPVWLNARVIEPEFWAANIKPGMILFEIGGVDLAVAEEALSLAASKLPIVTKIAFKPTKD